MHPARAGCQEDSWSNQHGDAATMARVSATTINTPPGPTCTSRSGPHHDNGRYQAITLIEMQSTLLCKQPLGAPGTSRIAKYPVKTGHQLPHTPRTAVVDHRNDGIWSLVKNET